MGDPYVGPGDPNFFKDQGHFESGEALEVQI